MQCSNLATRQTELTTQQTELAAGQTELTAQQAELTARQTELATQQAEAELKTNARFDRLTEYMAALTQSMQHLAQAQALSDKKLADLAQTTERLEMLMENLIRRSQS